MAVHISGSDTTYKGFQNPDQFMKDWRQVPKEQVLPLGISLTGMSQHSSQIILANKEKWNNQAYK